MDIRPVESLLTEDQIHGNKKSRSRDLYIWENTVIEVYSSFYFILYKNDYFK